MRRIRSLTFASFVVLLAACSKTPHEPVAASTPTPEVAVASTPTPKPVVASAATPEPSASPAETPAPNRSFYLTQRISLATDDGVISFPAGTKVLRIGEDAGGLKVQAPDGTMLTVRPDQITEDGSVGARYSQADADAKRRQADARSAALRAIAARQIQQAKAAGASGQTYPVLVATPSWNTDLDQGAFGQTKDPAPAKKKKK